MHLPGYSPIAYVERLDSQANQALHAEAAAYLSSVAQRLSANGRNIYTHVLFSPQPAAALLVAAEQQHADVIALSTHGRRGVRRMLLGSVADKVVRGAHMPVLVFRPAEG